MKGGEGEVEMERGREIYRLRGREKGRERK